MNLKNEKGVISEILTIIVVALLVIVLAIIGYYIWIYIIQNK